MKRLFDIFVCIVTAPIILTLCVLVGVIYYLCERESPLFRQTRVGKNELPFTIFKLRTMRVSTAELGTHQVDGNSVTRLGRMLRTTKLDETPQLWNVLIGEMSLVGPRPCLFGQQELILERRKLGVFEVLPGITGQSQLDGIDMSNPVALAISDAKAIANASFLSDFIILLNTVLGKGFGDKIKTGSNQ